WGISRWHRGIFTEAGARRGSSDIQPDRPHEFDAVALGDDAGTQLEIELELAIDEFVLEVNVHEGARVEAGDFRQCQIVGADQHDGAAPDQRPNDALRADPS